MSIGFFIAHKYYPDYLNYTVPSITSHIGANQLIVLGDETNKTLERFNCKHYLLDHYTYDIKEMKTKIKNCFVNTYPESLEYETFCYLRWVYIRNYMVAHGIDQCVYFDSDVVLLDDILPFLEKINMNENTYFNLSKNKMIHMPCLTIISLKVLNIFIEFMKYVFSSVKEKHLEWMFCSQNISRQTLNLDMPLGAISDMTVFGDFLANHDTTWFNPFFKYPVNGIYNVDIELLGPQLGYYINSNINNLLNTNISLFYKNPMDCHYYHNEFKILLLHFQGKSKVLIKPVYENYLNGAPCLI